MTLKFSKEKKIKIAISGCGKISKNHLEAISTLKDFFQLIAVCDISQENLNNISKSYKVKCYTDFEEMISKEELDLVTICTPSGIHPAQTKLAAKKNINVITEKPMATNLYDGLQMVRSCSENNVKLFVVKQLRLNPTFQQLKKAIQDKRFGKLYISQINVLDSTTVLLQ